MVLEDQQGMKMLSSFSDRSRCMVNHSHGYHLQRPEDQIRSKVEVGAFNSQIELRALPICSGCRARALN